MKIAIAALFASAVSARQLDQNNYNQQAEEYDETSFLKNYEQVFLKCVPNQKVMSEDGTYDYNAVVYRMCPTGEACSSKGKVCDSGYGDYVVGLQTYVQQFFDQFDDEQDNYNNQNQNNGYDFGEYGQCRELNIEANDDGNNQNNGQEVQYFMGPACTEDGDVRMALFTDQYCRPDYEAEVSLEDLIGVEMPYQNGGLMDDDECKAYYCWAANDNGEYELNRFCEELYANSAYKCEEKMEYVSAVNGMNTNGCETVSQLMPQSTGGGGAKIFLIILLVAAVVGVAVYFVMQQKKKQSGASEGLMM